MSDEKWDVDDDAQLENEVRDFTHPVKAGIAFLAALADLDQFGDVIAALVTPESLSDWGDFRAAAHGLAEIDNWGVGSEPMLVENAGDVAYVKILRGVTQTYQSDRDQSIMIPAVVTLVWRPEFDRWLAHAIGEPIDPDELPRTSPGIGPSF